MDVIFYQEMNLDTIGLAMLVFLITVVVTDDKTDVKSVDNVDILMEFEVTKSLIWVAASISGLLKMLTIN